MIEKAAEMSGNPRKCPRPAVRENWRQSALVQRRAMKAFVREQAELRDEANVGQRDLVADEKCATGLQRLLDTGGIDGERLGGARMDIAWEILIAQTEEVDLSVPGKDQAGVEKAVDA